MQSRKYRLKAFLLSSAVPVLVLLSNLNFNNVGLRITHKNARKTLAYLYRSVSTRLLIRGYLDKLDMLLTEEKLLNFLKCRLIFKGT